MNETPTVFTRKRIFLSIFFLIVISLAFILLSYTRLTITSASTEEKFIYIRNNTSSEAQSFTLTQGSKTFTLPRGDYSIEITGRNESSSIYKKRLGFFSDTLEVDLMQQKNSVYLGRDELPCALDTNRILSFYSCDQDNIMTIQTAGQTSHTHDEEEVSEDSIEAPEVLEAPDESFSGSLKYYNGDFIEARAFNKTLIIKLRDHKGYKPETITIPDFNGLISKNTFAISPSGNFSVFDHSNNTILLFESIKDTNPDKVKIDPEIIDTSFFDLWLFSTKDTTYLVNTRNSDNVEFEGDHDEKPSAKTDPKILTISNQEKKIVKEQDLPEDWVIREADNTSSDTIIFLLSGNREGEAYFYDVGSGLEKAEFKQGDLQYACWTNNDTLYYVANESSSIYQFSPKNNASFLVYKNSANFISDINCTDNQLYFSLENKNDEGINTLYHYKLGDKDQVGARLDSVLPLYRTFSRDTFKVEETRNGLSIKLDYDSNKNGAPSKQSVKNEISELLKGKGVEPANINMLMQF